MNGSDAGTRTSVGADENEIAAQFVRARRNAVAIRRYPGVVPSDLATAYRCQDLAIDRWPDRHAGWKVARIAREWQASFPAERLIGPVLARNVHVAISGETVDCPIFEDGFAAVEAEIVIRIGADAPPARLDWTLDEALALVADVHIGVEVASSPLATLNDLGAGAVISDFGNNWGVVVGPAIPDWRNMREIVAATLIDDVLAGRGTAVMQTGPFGALLFTLANCAARGRPLRAGDVVSTGMITGVHDIRIGQQSHHVFEGCGEVRCRAVRAVALP